MTNKEIKIIHDTNVLISSIFWRGNPHRAMRYGYERKYKLILSKAVDEILQVGFRTKFVTVQRSYRFKVQG